LLCAEGTRKKHIGKLVLGGFFSKNVPCFKLEVIKLRLGNFFFLIYRSHKKTGRRKLPTHMSRRVTIKFNATLQELVLSDPSIERRPGLQFNPSRALWREIVATEPLELNKPVEVTLGANISTDIPLAKIIAIAKDSFVTVTGYTDLRATEWCQKFAGSARAPLLALFNKSNPGAPMALDLRVRMAESGKFSPKMKILIQPVALRIDTTEVLLEGDTEQFLARYKAMSDEKTQLLTDYIMQIHSEFKALPLTFAQTSRIGSYMWSSALDLCCPPWAT
jgi:hypothetical protein